MGKIGSLLDKLSRPKGDRLIWLIVFVLLSVSIIEVFSASSRQTFGKASYLNPIMAHMVHVSFGVVAIYLCHIMKRFGYRALSMLLILGSLAGLAFLCVKGMHSDKAERWIDLGFFQLQPSEFAKLAVVLIVSQMLSKLERTDRLSQIRTFGKIMALTAVVCLMIVMENLSTAILIFFVVVALMIFGGIYWKYMTYLTVSLAAFCLLAIFLFKSVPPQTIRDCRLLPARTVTWQARVLDFFDQDEQYSAAEYARKVAPDKTQETHARIAVATSAIFGKLPGNSDQRDYLQEANSDFIFAIIIEEMGMAGALVIMAAYVLLFLRVGRIVVKCKNRGQLTDAYMAAGIGLLLVTQAFLNMSVAVGLGPVTGQPLPLVSKGGSSMLMSGIAVGILLGISSSVEDEEQPVQSVQEDLDGNETETIDC